MLGICIRRGGWALDVPGHSVRRGRLCCPFPLAVPRLRVSVHARRLCVCLPAVYRLERVEAGWPRGALGDLDWERWRFFGRERELWKAGKARALTTTKLNDTAEARTAQVCAVGRRVASACEGFAAERRVRGVGARLHADGRRDSRACTRKVVEKRARIHCGWRWR